MSKSRKKADTAALRRQAERKLRGEERVFAPVADADVRKLAHELQVHQVELQMQNEELQQAEKALADSQAQLTAMIEHAPTAMLLVDRERHVRRANVAAAQLAGRSTAEMRGLRGGEALRCLNSLDDPRGCGFGPACQTCPVRLAMKDTLEKRVNHSGVEARIPFDQGGKREELTFLVSTAPVSCAEEQLGLICLQDITDRRSKEEELRKLNRTLRALSSADRAMMRATDEAQYLAQVCRIVVESCGHAMVWIGYAEEDEGKTVRSVASAGFDEGYLKALNLTWADTERGHGPTGRAIRTGKPWLCRNMLTDPSFTPWREQALKRGYASSIALPLLDGGKAFGALMIYSRQPDPFSEDEVQLLVRLADGLAYGIVSLRAAKTIEMLSRFPQENPHPVLRVNRAGILLYANSASRPLLEEWQCAVGQPVPAHWRELASAALASGSRPALDCACGGRIFSFELAPIAEAGYVNLYGKDITKRKLAEEALESSEERAREHAAHLQAVLDAAPALIWIAHDRECRNITANHAAYELLRAPYGSRLAESGTRASGGVRHFRLFRDGVELKPEETALQHVASSGKALTDFEMDIVFNDGTVRSLLGNVTPIPDAEGRPDGAIAAFVDITAYKHAEEERGRLEHALMEANATLEQQVEERTSELRQSNVQLKKEIQERRHAEEERERVENIARARERLATLGELAAGVAHEIRNPLQGTMAFLEMAAKRSGADEKLRALLLRVEEGLREMDRVAAQLLDLARPGSEHSAASPLEPLVERAWSFLHLRAAKQGVSLERTFEPGLPEVQVNAARMAEAFLNLFKNSLDACEDGGAISVRARLHPARPDMVEVIVKDNGPGIPADVRSRVFEPFFTTKPIGKGTGLGLPVVKSIVESCGGSVGIVDTSVAGTTIGLGLPVAVAADHKHDGKGFVIS